MKRIIIITALVVLSKTTFGQMFKTTTGSISFHSHAALEEIEAKNNQVTAALDAGTGKLAFIVPIKSFEFDKSLMQTHFNDTYMESDTYIKSTFDGKIDNNDEVSYNKGGTTTVNVSGKLTIHGVTKDVTAAGTATVNDNSVTLKSSFKVKLADYKIKNDKVQNIANEIEVNVNVTLPKQ
jgi:polyisoprenoid-binding protein YceI